MKKLAALAFLALALGGCLRMDVFVFRPKAADPALDLMDGSVVPAELRRELKTEIVSADGTVVNAYLLQHKAGDGTEARRHGVALIYSHGQNNNIASSRDRLDLLWQLGYTVLAYDARGYGKTVGDPTEESHYADARAAREWLETKSGFSAENVGFYGRSLGSLWVTKLAAERPPRVLVLESPVLSIQQILDDSLSLDTPGHWYVDSLMDNERELPAFTGSLLIMHGTVDDYVQPANGDRLHAVAEGHASPNRIWRVEGADHGNVPCKDLVKADTGDGCKLGMSDGYVTEVTKAVDAAMGLR
jgi:fermentation-respiration switch protein FrsA (DUF1100 family)